jgi:hypothetical protein
MSIDTLAELWQSPWVRIAVVVAGFLFGAVLLGLCARVVAVILLRELTRSALLRTRLVGGVVGAILAYIMPGLGGLGGGFGPGESAEQRLVSSADPDRQTPSDKSAPKDQPRAGVFRIELVRESAFDKAGKPKNRFFVLPEKRGELADVDAVIKHLDSLVESGRIKPGDLIELNASDDSPAPDYNPEVRELRRRVEEKGFRFHVAAVNPR